MTRQQQLDAYDEFERRIEAYRRQLHRHNDATMTQSARPAVATPLPDRRLA